VGFVRKFIFARKLDRLPAKSRLYLHTQMSKRIIPAKKSGAALSQIAVCSPQFIPNGLLYGPQMPPCRGMKKKNIHRPAPVMTMFNRTRMAVFMPRIMIWLDQSSKFLMNAFRWLKSQEDERSQHDGESF
jgi:hypothetical protein